jgi:hypothetical protein
MTLNTPTEPTQPVPAPSASALRRGLPRWAWVVIVLLAVIALVATSVAVFAPRGRAVTSSPRPVAVATSAPAAGTILANGCLGGFTDPDQALLIAQKQAPLTPNGAAAFTATLVRWTSTTPVTPLAPAIARQVLTKDATTAAQKVQSNAQDSRAGLVSSVNFATGLYYVEASDAHTATVSYLVEGKASLNGVSQGTASVFGTVHLVAVGGTWHLRDVTLERPLENLRQVGLPYMGGC